MPVVTEQRQRQLINHSKHRTRTHHEANNA